MGTRAISVCNSHWCKTGPPANIYLWERAIKVRGMTSCASSCMPYSSCPQAYTQCTHHQTESDILTALYSCLHPHRCQIQKFLGFRTSKFYVIVVELWRHQTDRGLGKNICYGLRACARAKKVSFWRQMLSNNGLVRVWGVRKRNMERGLTDFFAGIQSLRAKNQPICIFCKKQKNVEVCWDMFFNLLPLSHWHAKIGYPFYGGPTVFSF